MAESWHEEMLRHQRALSGRSAVAATQDTQEQIRQNQVIQTAELTTALTANTAATEDQTVGMINALQQNTIAVESLRGAYSGTVQQLLVAPLSTNTIIHNPVTQDRNGNAIQTWRLQSVYAYLTTAAQVGDRFLTLELTAPNIPPWSAGTFLFPVSTGDATRRTLYRGFQSAAVPANTSRFLMWAQDTVSDNFSRIPIGKDAIEVSSDFRWRIHSSASWTGDQLVALFNFTVNRS